MRQCWLARRQVRVDGNKMALIRTPEPGKLPRDSSRKYQCHDTANKYFSGRKHSRPRRDPIPKLLYRQVAQGSARAHAKGRVLFSRLTARCQAIAHHPPIARLHDNATDPACRVRPDDFPRRR